MGTRLLLLLPVALATLVSGKSHMCDNLSADIVFLVDWSAKLHSDDTTNLKTILKAVVTDKWLGKPDNRLGLVWFSDNAQVGFNLAECNMDVSCMQQKIDQAPVKGGRSNFPAAVETARTKVFGNQGDRPGNNNIYIFISDGSFYGDESTKQKLSDELGKVNAAGGRIAAIVVGEKLNTGFFAERVSKPTVLNLYASYSYEKLKNDYMLQNWLSILCRDEKAVTGTLTAKDCEQDIVLMIDVSGSIIDNDNKVISNWYHLVTFMETFMKTVANKYDDVRLALMYFNDAPSTKFNFNDCQHSENVTCMVEKIYPGVPPESTTDMKTAFRYLKDNFIDSTQNRDKAKDLVIFMTDGFPNPDDVGKTNNQIIAEIKEEADKVADKGVKIMGIAVTDKTNKDMIRQVVSEPKDHYLKVFGSYLELTNDVLGVIDTGCTRKGDQCQAKIDLVILVDWSSKIANEVDNVKACLSTLFDLSRIDRDHVMIAIGLIGSNTDPLVYLGSCSNARCLKDRLSRARTPRGKADVARALDYARNTLLRSGGRSDARDIVMLITDNMADQDQGKVKAASDNLKRNGIRLSVASVTEFHDSSLLTSMITWPFDDHMFTVTSYLGLNELFAASWEKNCDGYGKIIEPPPTPTPEIKFDCVADIILLVDKSANLVQESETSGRQTLANNWVYLQGFIERLVTYIQKLYKDQIRVALIYFDDKPSLRFNLGACEDATCLEAAIKSPVPSGGVDIAAALQMVTDQVIGSQGDRDSVNNVIIVVTDGFPPHATPGLERPSVNIGHVIKENFMTKILGVGVNLGAKDSDAMHDLVSNPPSYYSYQMKSYSELYQKHYDVLQRACDSQDKCNLTSDSVILVEWSNRISDKDAKFIRYYLRDLINKVEVGAQNFKMAIIWVNDQATLGLDLNACADDACLIKHVMTHQHPRTGRANFKLAFEKAVNIFKGPGTRPGAIDSILAVMDGRMQNKAEMMEAAETAKALPARLAIVPVGSDIDQDFHDMVSQPWTLNYFPADHWAQISRVVNTMWDRICPTTAPAPEPAVEPEESPDCLIDLALLVDHSGSIIGDEKRIMHNWYDLKKFLIGFITDIKARYKAEVQISLTFFAGQPDLKFNFGQCPDVACMVDHINKKKAPAHTTNMPKAFEFIQNRVFGTANDRKNVSDVLVFLTDGFPNPFIKSEVEHMFRIIDNLKREEVTIFPIGVTNKVNEDLLKRVASNPDELMHQSGNFRELVEKTAKLVRDTCNARCKGAACDSVLDITLLIDTSTKMMTGFTEQGVRRMVQYLITCARVDPNKVHLALIYYHSKPEVLMNLGSCTDQACVRRESSKPIPTGTGSDLAGALQFVREQVFNGRGGDRREAPNKLLIITNSEPDISDAAIMSEGARLKKDGTFIHALGIGQNLHHLGFRRLVSGPDHYRFDNTIVGLRRHVASMKTVLCGQGTNITVINFNRSTTCMYDINLLVDLTASLTIEEFLHIQDFLIRFVSYAKSEHNGTIITLVTVYEEVKVVINFNTCNGNMDVPCMLELIRKLPPPHGNPDLMKAFDLVVTEVFSRPENNPRLTDVTLLITDGFIQPFNPQLFQVTDEVKESGIKVMGIGLGLEVNLAILRTMTSEPKDINAISFTFEVLVANAEAMVHRVCSIEESECKTPGDIIFVMDSSGSIGLEKFEMGKDFIINLINMFPVEKSGIQIGIIQFSSTSELIFNLNKYKTKAGMIEAVKAIKYMGQRTNTPSALRYVRQTMLTSNNGDRPKSPNAVIVITDGGSNEEWQEDTITEAVKLHEKATTFVVQVGKWVNEYELKAIASHPYSKHRLEVEDYDKLNSIAFDIVDLACHNTDPCSEVVCQNGGTPVDTWRGCLCICPEGYNGADCSNECEDEADVIFAVDKSASMHNRDLLMVVDFLRNTTENLNFGMHRIGLMSFSDRPKIHLHVDQVAVKDVVLDMLDIYHKGGKTNTGEALRTIRTQMFTKSKIRRKSNGDEVARIVVLIIDGKSSNRQTAWTEAMKLREEGVHILVVGIGDGVRQIEMEGIASQPYGGGIIRLKTFSEFPQQGHRILNAICNNGEDCDTCPEDSKCVVVFGNTECKPCPDGYSGPFCVFECGAKMDVGLLLDVSGSIRASRFEKIQKFIAEVLTNMTISPDETRVGAVSWSDSAKRQFSLNQYKYAQDVIHAVRSIQFQGRRTNTQNALDSMRNVFRDRGERPDAPNKVLMITDGGSNIRQDETIPKATMLKKDTGAHISIVAIGDDMNMRELKGIASLPVEANIFEVETEDDLDKFVPLVAKAFCDDENECISNPCQNGGRCVDMLRSYRCTCPDGWAGVHCTKECRNSHDIALVLDVSGSVMNIYDIIMEFSRRLVLALPVHNGRTRVGMVSFADRSSIKFRLTDHKTRNDILNALTLERWSGRTNMYSGLTSGGDILRSGGRNGVQDTLVLVTDGMPTVEIRRTPEAADRVKDRDVRIVGVAVGGQTDRDMLATIASDPKDENLITILNKGEIDAAVDAFLDLVCTQ